MTDMTPVAEMTNTQIVEAVIAHLEAQGERAHDGERCLYYMPTNGNRCAIGGILPLEMAREVGLALGDVVELALEYPSAGQWLGLRETSDGDTPRAHFLREVQAIHDDPNAWTPDGFVGQEQLRDLLRAYA